MNADEWFRRIQGTQTAILRALGEVIAAHPERLTIERTLLLDPVRSPPASPLELAEREAEAESILAVLLYAQVAAARAAALRAEGPPN